MNELKKMLLDKYNKELDNLLVQQRYVQKRIDIVKSQIEKYYG
jgi:hypothetical protein